MLSTEVRTARVLSLLLTKQGVLRALLISEQANILRYLKLLTVCQSQELIRFHPHPRILLKASMFLPSSSLRAVLCQDTFLITGLSVLRLRFQLRQATLNISRFVTPKRLFALQAAAVSRRLFQWRTQLPTATKILK